MPILVATDGEVVVMDVEQEAGGTPHGIDGRPTCLTADPLVQGRAWCGTHRNGLFRTDDGGASWRSVGLAGRLIMAVTSSPAGPDVGWGGTPPRQIRRSGDAEGTSGQTRALWTAASSSQEFLSPAPHN